MLEVQAASFRLAGQQEVTAQLDRFLVESTLADARALSEGRTGADLQFASRLRGELDRFRRQMEDEIQQLQGVRERAAVVYEKAYRDREALESLRERERRVYEIKQARKRQKELDSAYLQQRWHHRDG